MTIEIEKLVWSKDLSIVNKIREDIPIEVDKIISHLRALPDERKPLSLERTLNNLFLSYFSVDVDCRKLPKEERDTLRPIKNVIYEAICLLMSRVKRELNINCSQQFINKWRGKVSYFPFD